jgi:hypothetical protein
LAGEARMARRTRSGERADRNESSELMFDLHTGYNPPWGSELKK